MARPEAQAYVDRMLDCMAHRGRAGRRVMSAGGVTLGAVWPPAQAGTLALLVLGTALTAQDAAGRARDARAQARPGGLVLSRDALGVAPLYYGQAPGDGALCFASEVKALLAVTADIHELPPGHEYDGKRMECRFALAPLPTLDDAPEHIAQELRRRLAAAVEWGIGDGQIGSWLSGGLDSSAIAALVRPHVPRLHTFAAGLPGAPDLDHARTVAEHLHTQHHEVLVTVPELLAALPEVIRHLESFDALLVRSSITNYLVARRTADYAPVVFSGEGGDELFAGYEYLKGLDPAALPGELADITGRLHNTALQRVDRSAAAWGILAHVPFLEPDVVDYALRIPVEFKLRAGVEKWILRRALDGALPASVLSRPKAKFWEGAGVGASLAQHAGEHISDADFDRERRLPNGWTLDTKEELLYYRIFREHFGGLEDYAWMGRTKGAPRVQPHALGMDSAAG